MTTWRAQPFDPPPIYRGAEWEFSFKLEKPAGTAVNVTGMTGTFEVRPSRTSPTIVLSVPLAPLDLVNQPGVLGCERSAAQTTALTKRGEFLARVNVVDPSNVLGHGVNAVLELLEGTQEITGG